MRREAQTSSIRVGQLRKQTVLGTSATYRVASLEDDHALLEVWEVPGLERGETVRVTAAAAAAMEVIGTAALPAPRPRADAA
jgi:hypothetical protein